MATPSICESSQKSVILSFFTSINEQVPLSYIKCGSFIFPRGLFHKATFPVQETFISHLQAPPDWLHCFPSAVRKTEWRVILLKGSLNLIMTSHFSQDTTQASSYFNWGSCLTWLQLTFPIPSLHSPSPWPHLLLTTWLGPWPSFSSLHAKLLAVPGLCACYSSIWHMLPLASSRSSAKGICCFCLPSTLIKRTPLLFFKSSLS